VRRSFRSRHDANSITAALAPLAAAIALAAVLPPLPPPALAAAESPPRAVVPPERLGADSLLARVVRGDLVDYGRLEQERDALARSLRAAADLDSGALAGWNPPARLAFYLNVYNLATLDLIARERRARGGSLASIREIPDAWSGPRWRVAGRERTLDELEHEVIRKRFPDPRVHMALVCASRSCPALRSEPYDGRRLDAQLDDAARRFVTDETRNRFTPRSGAIAIAKLFDWYGEDFTKAYRDSSLERRYGAKEGAVLAFASRYLPEATARIWRAERLRIEYLDYDWSLNEAPAAKP
jgi:hypothetical protein